MTDIAAIVNEYEAARKAFQEKGQAAFKAAFKTFFDENPEIKSILWAQYTPYFNDGEECVFGVEDMYFSTTVENINDADRAAVWGDNKKFYGSNPYKPVPAGVSVLVERFKAFEKALSPLPNEIYKETFGDHVIVFATRHGFETEEFEHD